MCSCPKAKKEYCPLSNKCLSSSIIYCATVKKSGNFFIGMTETEFKRRLSTHKHSFNHENDRNATALSQHIWEISENKNPQNVKWELFKKSHPRKAGSKFCMLCLEEKLFVLKNNKNPASLNKKSEIFRCCFHRSKWKLSAIKN